MARTPAPQSAPAGVRYVGHYGEQVAFPADPATGLGRKRVFLPGVAVALEPWEVEAMLTHPDYEPVTAEDLAPNTAAPAVPAETPEN